MIETIEIILDSIQLVKMTDEEYFSDKYKDYISNSGLGLLNPEQDGSIEIYTSGFNNKYSEAFELGGAIHAIILQPNEYFISDIEKPSSKLGVFADCVRKIRKKGNIKLADAIEIAKIESDYYANSLTKIRLQQAIRKSIEYYLARMKDDKVERDKKPIYLSSTLRQKALTCIQNISKNKKIMEKINPDPLFGNIEIFNEYAILCDVKVTVYDEEIILKLKSKLDNFTLDHEAKIITLNDLKSTGKPVKFFMGNYINEYNEDGKFNKRWIDGSFQKYHYFRQIAMYIWLLNAYVTNIYKTKYKLEANMLLVETIPNFDTKIASVNGKYINRGLAEFKELVITLARWNIQQNQKTRRLES